ncbi:MAG: LysR family transcriptional regulator [Pseudomonadota bacterium]
MKAQVYDLGRKMKNVDWSDVPFILSVCEAGSLAGAARSMDVNHSTVFRRIEGLEKRLGVRLFERRSQGYVMTPAGEFFYEKATVLRDGLNQIELELAGKDLRLEGRLTVTTTDSLLHVLTPLISHFQEKHPDVELRIIADANALDLSRRDADVALRPTLNPPEHWVGRKLSKVLCATYASTDHHQTARTLAPAENRWVMLDDDLDQSPMSKITNLKRAADAQVTVLSSVMGVYDAVRAGMGLAVLPCYLGDQSKDLVRLDEPDQRAVWDLWLLAHPDVRRSARVHAFFEFASKHVDEALKTTPKTQKPIRK